MYPRLVADIGGTNARFALATDDTVLQDRKTLPTEQFRSIEQAIAHYLDGLDAHPRGACLAIACPVAGEQVQMTNHHWHFSISALEERFGWERLAVINDFRAIALSLPHLERDQYLTLGGGHPGRDGPLCVLGPGTGLGVALAIPHVGDWLTVPTEGGHASVAPTTKVELAIFEYWLERGLSLSRENLVSGPGLYRLYAAHCALKKKPLQAEDAAGVSELAKRGDAPAGYALEMFFALLGSICGDQALATGARGGVFLAGGMLPRMKEPLLASNFRDRFEDKPPMSHYLRPIATALITEPDPGLVGAAHYPLGTCG